MSINKIRLVYLITYLCSFAIMLFLCTAVTVVGQVNNDSEVAVYMDHTKTPDERAADIVERLTLEEKVMQLGNSAPAIQRLNIGDHEWANESLHGIAWSGIATVFPQAIAMSSTWDPALIKEIATAISDEARVKNNLDGKKLTYWTPTVNMSRDPRWGRIEETYGEDPHLSSRLAVSFVKGMQGDHPRYLKTVSTLKHYAVNNTEFNRTRSSSDVDKRDLLEYYLPVFEAGVIEGKAHSLMTAYNAVNGVPAAANKMLLSDILRGRWNFNGYVVTDCGVVKYLHQDHKYTDTPQESAAVAVKSGNDLTCASFDINVTQQYGLKAVEEGLLTESNIDIALKRLFKARVLLGEFDPPSKVPYTQIPDSALDSQKHKDLALKTARKSMVLLKNENSLLPLDNEEIKSIAVIGPNADRAVFGGYSGTPSESYSPLRGITAKMGVPYETFGIHLEAESFDEFQGVQTSGATEGGMTVSHVENNHYTVYKDVNFKNKVIFQARIASATEGGQIEVRLDSLDGRVIANVDVPYTGRWQHWETVSTNIEELSGTHDLYLKFTGGEGYLFNLNWIKFDAEKTLNTGIVSFTEGTTISGERDQEEFDRAVHLAKNSDVAVLVVGTDLSVASEGGDRKDLDLPGVQEELIKAVMEVNPRTVVVLTTGAPLSINWTNEHVPAILTAWYGGQSQGIAISDILFGDYNPGGRLSSTWYKSVNDLPEFTDYRIRETDRTYLYFKDEVLYPFGYGLSYTDFEYSNLHLSSDDISQDGDITVTANIQNRGRYAGDEVVQLYIREVESSIKRPLKQLAAFERISLEPGEKKMVTLNLPYKSLSYYDDNTGNFIVNEGDFEIMVGTSSEEILLRADINATEGIASDTYYGLTEPR